MLTSTFETTPSFKAGIQGLIRKCRINARVVVEKETGELIKTLVKVSPPKLPSRTRESIDINVQNKFAIIGNEEISQDRIFGTKGRFSVGSGILWYAVSTSYLRGIAPASDKRDASQQELYKLYHTITKSGVVKSDFKTPRRRQKVLFLQTILTKRATREKLKARIRGHVGRLKAGWMALVFTGIVKIYGANMPPQWVTRHAAGVRGTFINELGIPDRPALTIINRARGVTGKRVNMAFFMQLALKARAAAMRTNCLLFMKGKKNIADYAR